MATIKEVFNSYLLKEEGLAVDIYKDKENEKLHLKVYYSNRRDLSKGDAISSFKPSRKITIPLDDDNSLERLKDDAIQKVVSTIKKHYDGKMEDSTIPKLKSQLSNKLDDYIEGKKISGKGKPFEIIIQWEDSEDSPPIIK